jgi:hypothetical protein
MKDRGIDTFAYGYSKTEQLVDIIRFYFQENSEADLRNALAFLLSNYYLLRGENARNAELADLQTVMLDCEGPSECPALVLLMKHGKTNQFGRVEISACMRNTNVEICPFMAMGSYLFWRWHAHGEQFPSFESSRDWFDYKLLIMRLRL